MSEWEVVEPSSEETLPEVEDIVVFARRMATVMMGPPLTLSPRSPLLIAELCNEIDSLRAQIAELTDEA